MPLTAALGIHVPVFVHFLAHARLDRDVPAVGAEYVYQTGIILEQLVGVPRGAPTVPGRGAAIAETFPLKAVVVHVWHCCCAV